MGKKLLNILLTVVIAGFVGYLVATWTFKRRIQEQEEVATVVSGTVIFKCSITDCIVCTVTTGI